MLELKSVFLSIVLISCIVFGLQNADGTRSENKGCSISIQSSHLPVFYEEQRRMNSNGSFYPGDGFHYLFKFSGSDTCVSFSPQALQSKGIDVLSHHILMGNPNQASSYNGGNGITSRDHSHQNNDVTIAYMKTTHYYEIIETDVKYKQCRGGCHDPYIITYILAENPTVSIREDKTMTKRQADLINNSSTCYSCKDFVKKETYSWGFTIQGTNHEHGELHQYEDPSSMTAFEQLIQQSCSSLQKHQGCVFGHAEIKTELDVEQCLYDELAKRNINPASPIIDGKTHIVSEDTCVESHNDLSLTVSGTKIVCDSEKCKTKKVSKAGSLVPNVIPPTINLELTKPSIRDEDTFDAKNKDGTYYMWDPLAVYSEPQIAFKNERYKTMIIETEKNFNMPVQSEYECSTGQCDYLIDNPDLFPDTKYLGYGDDFTIYNATKPEMLGTQDFEYHIKVYNIDRFLNQTSANINALVVTYEPQFESFPYLVLKDGHAKSWDNRNGIGLEYFGSIGSGPDDEHMLHEERRSKINEFDYESHAFRSNPNYPYPIETQMSWSDASEYENNNECFSSEVNQGVFESYGTSGNFVSSGAAKIRFDFAVSEEVRNSAFQDVTISNTLQSEKFAGIQTNNLTSYEYTYPDSNFGNKVYLITSDAEGKRTKEKVSVKMTPDSKSKYTQDYVCEKIMKDSENVIFSNIAVSEMYGKNSEADGTGIAELYLQRTSTWFTPYHLSQEDNYLDFTLDEGFDTSSPYTMELTVGEQTRTVPVYVSFTDDVIYVANTDQNNILNITSGKNAIVLRVDENFGPITRVVQNDEDIHVAECGNKCPISLPREDVTIEVFNEWGGRAYAEYAAPLPSEEKTVNVNWTTVSVIVALATTCFIVFKVLKKLKKESME